jgi:predicted PurR-regulated permease PerM
VAEQERPSTATVIRITLVVVATLVLLYGVYLVRQVLVLVMVALFLAIGLDPFVRFFQRRVKIRRGFAVAAVFVGALLLISGFLAAVIPPLARQTVRLAQQIPDFAQRLSDSSSRFGELDQRFHIAEKVRTAVNDLPSLAAGSIGGALGVARSVGSTLVSLLTVTVLTIYFLLDLPKLVEGASKLVAKSRRKRVQDNAAVVFESISNYIVGNLATSIIAGVVSFVALKLLDVPYALPLAMWVAIADLIPLVGAMVGAIPAVMVAYFHGLGTGIGTTIYFIAYQQIENYVIQPRVMRQAVNVSAAAVLLSALIGATLLGFVGALIAIPIAASIKVIAHQTWIPRQDTA